MKINEVLKLLGAGYKKADIDAMIEAEKSEPEAPAPSVQEEPQNEVPEVDYKSMCEELTNKLATVTEQLKNAQAETIRHDSAGLEKPVTTIADLQNLFR